MKSIWGFKQPQEKKDMNWAQAKWANPRLKPNADSDRDGVKNQFDCKPLNRKKQDDDRLPSDSKWKKKMYDDFDTVGDLKHFAEGE